MFSSKQLGVGVKGGAEGMVHATKFTIGKFQHSQNAGTLQINF